MSWSVNTAAAGAALAASKLCNSVSADARRVAIAGEARSAPAATASARFATSDFSCLIREGKRAAEVDLQSKTEALQHLLAVIELAAAAERVAAAAESAATAGARAWADAGADAADTTPQTLSEQALTLRQQAVFARTRAKGTLLALPAAEHAVEGAQLALDQAALNIRSAVGLVLGALLAPAFLRLARARRAYLESFNAIRSALEVEDVGFVGACNRNLVGDLRLLRDSLHALRLPGYTSRADCTDAPGFRSAPWYALARRLATDPDAALEDVDEG